LGSVSTRGSSAANRSFSSSHASIDHPGFFYRFKRNPYYMGYERQTRAECKECIDYRGAWTSRRESCFYHPSYTSNLPLITRKWKNSQWRTSSTRSLPPV